MYEITLCHMLHLLSYRMKKINNKILSLFFYSDCYVNKSTSRT